MIDNETQQILNNINANSLVWILKDEHGCVMLTTEDEDGVPIWSDKSAALAWATEDWSHCEAVSIDLSTWATRWTKGLREDDLMIMVNPSELQEHGVVLSPDEFAEAINLNK